MSEANNVDFDLGVKRFFKENPSGVTRESTLTKTSEQAKSKLALVSVRERSLMSEANNVDFDLGAKRIFKENPARVTS